MCKFLKKSWMRWGWNKVICANLRRKEGESWIFNFFPSPKGLFLDMGGLWVKLYSMRMIFFWVGEDLFKGLFLGWHGRGENLIAFKGWGWVFLSFFPFFQGVVFWMERGDFFPLWGMFIGGRGTTISFLFLKNDFFLSDMGKGEVWLFLRGRGNGLKPFKKSV